MLDGVDTTVGDLDDLIKRDKGGLQGRQLHQQLDGLQVLVFDLGDVLPAPRQTKHVKTCPQVHTFTNTWRLCSKISQDGICKGYFSNTPLVEPSLVLRKRRGLGYQSPKRPLPIGTSRRILQINRPKSDYHVCLTN